MSALFIAPVRNFTPIAMSCSLTFGIVNDLAKNVDWLVGENFARRVRQVDRALDAVAKTKFLRQPDLQPPASSTPPRPRSFSTI